VELTKRQKEALELMARGKSIDAAACEMHVSRSTIEKFLAQCKERLGAANLRHAVFLATRGGLIAVFIGVLVFADDARRSARHRTGSQQRHEVASV
jgi:DNA-binding CsgD family transcriptional regulator